MTIDDDSRKYVWGLGPRDAVSGSAIEVVYAERSLELRRPPERVVAA